MGFRFQKRITIFPGLRLNLSKRGASVSVGRRGAWFNFGGRNGKSVTLGLPGTGLSYRASAGKSHEPAREEITPAFTDADVRDLSAKARQAMREELGR
jgi:hypothetical protein